MKVNSTRFGVLEVNKDDVLTFKDGILGFEKQNKFIVLDTHDQTHIMWLQSTKDPEIAFPILEPEIFQPQYSAKLLPGDLNSIGVEDTNHLKMYTILTIPNNIKEISANLKAPILINLKTKEARQVVLQDNKLDIKQPIYKELKQYMTTQASDDSLRNKDVQSRAQNSDTERSESKNNADLKEKENQV